MEKKKGKLVEGKFGKQIEVTENGQKAWYNLSKFWTPQANIGDEIEFAVGTYQKQDGTTGYRADDPNKKPKVTNEYAKEVQEAVQRVEAKIDGHTAKIDDLKSELVCVKGLIGSLLGGAE